MKLKSKPIIPSEIPIYAKNYRFPEVHKKEVETQTDKLLKLKIIQPSKSPWNAPIWIVPKKLDASGRKKWRMVNDYRKLNEITIPDRYPIPNIEDIFDALGNSSLFTTLDLASGFHQIPIKPEHREKTAFSTHTGHFEYLKMPFGFKNAPSTFQRVINTCLSELLRKDCLVYIDDIIIFSKTFEEHIEKISRVFNELRKHKLLIQPDKSEFLKTSINYLGHIITKNGITPNFDRTKAIVNFPSPKNQKQIQQIFGNDWLLSKIH